MLQILRCSYPYLSTAIFHDLKFNLLLGSRATFKLLCFCFSAKPDTDSVHVSTSDDDDSESPSLTFLTVALLLLLVVLLIVTILGIVYYRRRFARLKHSTELVVQYSRQHMGDPGKLASWGHQLVTCSIVDFFYCSSCVTRRRSDRWSSSKCFWEVKAPWRNSRRVFRRERRRGSVEKTDLPAFDWHVTTWLWHTNASLKLSLIFISFCCHVFQTTVKVQVYRDVMKQQACLSLQTNLPHRTQQDRKCRSLPTLRILQWRHHGTRGNIGVRDRELTTGEVWRQTEWRHGQKLKLKIAGMKRVTAQKEIWLTLALCNLVQYHEVFI